MDGCVQVYTPEELEARLTAARKSGKPLRIKLGMDPTAPDIHLGHTVQLRKLRQFQDLGHKAVLIIGDFTARIGDPTGRSKTRPVLTESDVDENAQTYLDQAGRILDTSPEKLEIRRNSEWLAAMRFDDVIRLTAQMTVGQMLKRDDFRKRFESETPISLHELLYPLVQGWDSVNIASDVEIGGTDQTYNNLVGRDLQGGAGQSPQIVLILPLLRGLDGTNKMSKSLGNTIAVLDTPLDMFGKTMSIPDELLPEWFGLLTEVPDTDWQSRIAEHPMKAKDYLARQIGQRYHGVEAMEQAAANWHAHFGKGKNAEEIAVRVADEEIEDGGLPAWKLFWLAHAGALSRSEARRMVQGGAFEFDGQKITDPNTSVDARAGVRFKAGRHRSGELIKQPFVGVVTRG